MRPLAKLGFVLLLPAWLACCAGGEQGGISFTDDRGVSNQPFPNNYRAELLAFLRAYLNNPVGIRDAAMADPVQRNVAGRLRYVSCIRYTPREPDGSYRAPQERGVMYVDARLDRAIENAAEICAGATYMPFPEMES